MSDSEQKEQYPLNWNEFGEIIAGLKTLRETGEYDGPQAHWVYQIHEILTPGEPHPILWNEFKQIVAGLEDRANDQTYENPQDEWSQRLWVAMSNCSIREATLVMRETLRRDVAAELRELLSGEIPIDLLRQLARGVNREDRAFRESVARKKHPLIRQALPFAFDRLGWGNFPESNFADSAITLAFKDDIAKEIETVEPIVDNLVMWLPTQIDGITKAIVNALGYSKTPTSQASTIEIVACRAFMMGLAINDAVEEAIAKGELKKKG